MSLIADRAREAQEHSVMVDVLRELSRRWPNKFAAGAVAELLPMWRDSCASIPHGAWLPTARDITRSWPDGPPPSNRMFANEARKTAMVLMPEQLQTVAPALERPSVHNESHTAKADRLLTDLCVKLGTWSLAAQAFEIVLRQANHPDLEQAFRQGNAPPYIVDEAVAKVRKAHGLSEAA